MIIEFNRQTEKFVSYKKKLFLNKILINLTILLPYNHNSEISISKIYTVLYYNHSIFINCQRDNSPAV